jgi:predicted nicotinamide N-methyase
MCTAGIDDADPYWTRVWPSAVALASEVLRRPELVAGKRVCDLGCGLGVAGIAAALAGG